MLKIAIDTYYRSETEAYTVGLIFKNWNDSKPLYSIDVITIKFDRYIPGEFYKRELPCILDLLNNINISDFDSIIIDGYNTVKDNEGNIKPGLGSHLVDELSKLGLLHNDLDIIGIAKTRYCRSDEISYSLIRNNAKPLYCQSWKNNSLDFLRYMHGSYRIPTLLKLLDQQTKV